MERNECNNKDKDKCVWNVDDKKCVFDKECSEKTNDECQNGGDKCALVNGNCVIDSCAKHRFDNCAEHHICHWDKDTKQCLHKGL